MSDRDKLIELLDKAFLESDDNFGMPNVNQVADYLLANGVIVPPCNVGDSIYVIGPDYQDATKYVIKNRIIGKIIKDEKGLHWINAWADFSGDFADWGITAFPAKEEAEEKLKEINI